MKNLDRLAGLAEQSGHPKLRYAVQHIIALGRAESTEDETL